MICVQSVLFTMWTPIENAINRIGGTFDILLLTAIVLVVWNTGGETGAIQGAAMAINQLSDLLSSPSTQANILVVFCLTILFLIRDSIMDIASKTAKLGLGTGGFLLLLHIFTDINAVSILTHLSSLFQTIPYTFV